MALCVLSLGGDSVANGDPGIIGLCRRIKKVVNRADRGLKVKS